MGVLLLPTSIQASRLIAASRYGVMYRQYLDLIQLNLSVWASRLKMVSMYLA
jgi:hypothetical protein